MAEYRLYESEYRIMNMVWLHGPLRSRELVSLCLDEYGWNKSTTFTMLRKLCKKELLDNTDCTVCALVSRREVGISEGGRDIARYFGGSFAEFADGFFTANGGMSAREADELRALAEKYPRK